MKAFEEVVTVSFAALSVVTVILLYLGWDDIVRQIRFKGLTESYPEEEFRESCVTPPPYMTTALAIGAIGLIKMSDWLQYPLPWPFAMVALKLLLAVGTLLLFGQCAFTWYVTTKTSRWHRENDRKAWRAFRAMTNMTVIVGVLILERLWRFSS